MCGADIDSVDYEVMIIGFMSSGSIVLNRTSTLTTTTTMTMTTHQASLIGLHTSRTQESITSEQTQQVL